jgi:geranylgeranyl reductase family protein
VTTRCDVLIVGGGPAGSSCAWALTRAGADVLVLDRARFPRDKVCAGWITPSVLERLELSPDDYAATGRTIQEIRGFRTGVVTGDAIDTRYASIISYAIRRCEFDDYLLARSGARLLTGTALQSLKRNDGSWIANDEIEADVVIGAGGHFCPVARLTHRAHDARGLVVAQEIELRMPAGAACRVDGIAPELYFCADLEGYGWCVRKGEHLNVGFGRRDGQAFPSHVAGFLEWLDAEQRVPREATRTRWHGHAYLTAGSVSTPLVDDGLMLIGDAAGLAYAESGEGIRPAVESGLRAARTLIAARGRGRADLAGYEEETRGTAPSPGSASKIPRSLVRRAGRWLLGNPLFTRHVVLDRWFLRTHAG